jgi:hypothetical protein
MSRRPTVARPLSSYSRERWARWTGAGSTARRRADGAGSARVHGPDVGTPKWKKKGPCRVGRELESNTARGVAVAGQVAAVGPGCR